MLTVTDLVTYTFCPRKLYAIKRLGYREPLTKEMVLGSVIHESAELLTKELVATPLDVIEGVSQGQLRRILSKVMLRNKVRVTETGWELMECFRQASAVLDRFCVSREGIIRGIRTGAGTVKVEMPVESEKLQLKGRIDELRVFGDRVVPVELKSGQVPRDGVFHHHKIQLAAYALLLEERDFSVSHAVVSYIGDGSEREFGLNPFLRDEVIQINEGAQTLVLQAQAPRQGCGHCEACNVLSRSAGSS